MLHVTIFDLAFTKIKKFEKFEKIKNEIFFDIATED